MVQTFYLETILKIIGIAYITELGASFTKDAGFKFQLQQKLN